MLTVFAIEWVAVAAVLAEPFRLGWYAGAIAFQPLAAGLLRAAAARRWLRIDWLRERPVRRGPA